MNDDVFLVLNELFLFTPCCRQQSSDISRNCNQSTFCWRPQWILPATLSLSLAATVKTWFHRKYFLWRQLSPICSQLAAPTGSLQKMDIFSIFCIKCHIKSISDMSYQKWSLLHVYWMIWGTNRCIYIYCWAILQTYFQSEISFKSQKYPLTDSVGNDVADGVARLHVVHGDRHHLPLLSHCLLIRLWGGLNKTQF